MKWGMKYECHYVSSCWQWCMNFTAMSASFCCIAGLCFILKCKWILVTVWQISWQDAPTHYQHIPVRTKSLSGKAKWEAKTSTSLQTVMLRRSIKGNTVYIWFCQCFCPQINTYLFMMQWKQHFNLVALVAKDTVPSFKLLYLITQIKLNVCSLLNGQLPWFLTY